MEQLYNRRLGIQLDETSGFRLAECRFGGHAAGGGNFPEFDLLYADGRRPAVAADDPRLQVSLQREEDRLTVEYTLPGDFRAAIAYLLQEDRLTISVRVLEEAGAKLVSVGDRFFRLGKETADGEFQGAVIPSYSGRLLQFTSTPCAYHQEILQSARYIANFFALSYRRLGVILRPAHFSAVFAYGVGPEAIDLGLRQYFRPEQTENFATPLCHEERCVEFRLTPDDGRPQDWRDIAQFYRQEYLPDNPRLNPLYRDRMTSGSPLSGKTPNYADYLPIMSRLDYADQAFWVVCAHCPKFVNLDHLYWDFIPDPTRGDYFQFKKAAQIYGWLPYIHEDWDVVTKGRGWDEAYVRRRPGGELYQEGEWGGRASYFRSFIAFREQWPGFIDEVFDRWDVQPGDLWHDDVNGWYFWEDYNVAHPSTRDIDRQIRREVWTYCREKRGVSMSDECLMEGMTDLNDYSHWTFCYEAEVNDRIMMLPYLFLGKTYYAYTCFEAVPERDPRLPPINYAYSLLVGTKFGLTVSGPDYDMIAEAYFRNNLPWSYIADASILSLTEQDGRYTVRYSNGVELESCPRDNDYSLTVEGMRYHNRTPVNAKGFMALWESGAYPLAQGNARPFRTHLWQNHAEGELAGVKTTIRPDGSAEVEAATTLSPMPEDCRRYMRARQGGNNLEYLDTPDMLVLRRLPADIQCAETVELTEISSPENELRYIVRTEKRALLTVSLAEKGWGVRLYTEEYGRAEWHRELTVSCAGEVILSFQPYVYGERED